MSIRVVFALLTLLLVGVAAGAPDKPNRILVLGFDGMDWSTVDELQAKGALPNIKAFRARAAQAKLATDYDARSPIVWTTMATGMNMERHGITDFAVSTANGLVAISSTVRKVPAIWNMVSGAGRKVAVSGLWATFPAEDVNGVILSDRAGTEANGKVVSPESYRSTFFTELAKAHQDRTLFPSDEYIGPNDRMAAHFMPIFLKQDYDLVWAYLRGIDVVSHEYWKYWRPEGFEVPAAEMKKYGDVIPQKYRAMDAVIGRAVAAAGPDVNIFIVSDHGFVPLHPELLMVSLDMSVVLQHLGVLTLDTQGEPDLTRSTVYGWQAQNHRGTKYLRVAVAGRDAGGKVPAAEVAAVRAKLTAQLDTFTWADGTTKVFAVRDLNAKEKADVGTGGADFAVVVLQDNATYDLLHAGKKVADAIPNITGRSGYHRENPPGVFMAAGPDIDPKADLTGIRIHDICPTLLFGMGLPVGADFDGKAQPQVYTARFQAAHPLQTVPTYGGKNASDVTRSDDNDEQMEMLKKLGYLDP